MVDSATQNYSMQVYFSYIFSMTRSFDTKMKLGIFVDLGSILWLIALLRIILRKSIFHTFFDDMMI